MGESSLFGCPVTQGPCPLATACTLVPKASPAKDIPGEDRSHPLATVLRAFLLVIPACTWSGRILDGGRSLGSLQLERVEIF